MDNICKRCFHNYVCDEYNADRDFPRTVCAYYNSRFVDAADVVEVRHGRWFFTEYEFFTCSVCGESYYNGAESTAQAESYLNSGHTYKYCPNCGARMDKEDEHDAD